MSGSGRATNPPARKIKVEGRILVGQQIKAHQQRATTARVRQMSDEEIRKRGVDPASRSGQALAYGNGRAGIGNALQESMDDSKSLGPIWLKNAGFTASYAVFGSPGTGKTHLMLYLLSQIFGEIPARTSPEWKD